MLKDPVCGKRIKRNRAYIAIDYHGVTYYLCCPRCQADFERTPEQFARAEMGEKTKSAVAHAQAEHVANPLATKTTIVHGPAQ